MSATPPAAAGPGSRWEVFVGKEYLKFSAAHFIAYQGFREALHGHNYQLSVRVEGRLGRDGYVVDFGVVKAAARRICAELDERVVLPERSDCLTFGREPGRVTVTCEDGASFAFPETDVAWLPIVHSSAEELARWALARLRAEIPDLAERGARSIEVGVSEAPAQTAYYRESIG